MRKRIIIYIVALMVLLGLYLFFAPRAVKNTSEKYSPQFQKEIQTANQSSGFKGPTDSPSVKGPSGPPPTQ